MTWDIKRKVVDGTTQVELRRTFPRGGQMLVIVGLDGYNYGYDRVTPRNQWGKTTRGYNVRTSSNSAIDMTWDDWNELNTLILKTQRELEDA